MDAGVGIRRAEPGGERGRRRNGGGGSDDEGVRGRRRVVVGGGGGAHGKKNRSTCNQETKYELWERNKVYIELAYGNEGQYVTMK